VRRGEHRPAGDCSDEIERLLAFLDFTIRPNRRNYERMPTNLSSYRSKSPPRPGGKSSAPRLNGRDGARVSRRGLAEVFGRYRLPDGRTLRTLRDAGDYITKLPKAVHSAAEWHAAMEALILVADLGGPTMFARIGIMRAPNRHVERVSNQGRNDHYWGKRKLKRDE